MFGSNSSTSIGDPAAAATALADAVRTTLELVLDDELSKRKAAAELDTSRRTINRCLERLELYRLENAHSA